ncbi:sulfurtransferase complex subunit TusC [Pasteurellaceae bacterium 22721_9_1]
MKLAFVFKTSPHGSSVSREGLDAVLAASAFCEENEIAVFFIEDGIFNLLAGQQPECILQKDFIRTFKLLELYDIENCFVCQQSLQQYQLEQAELILPCLPKARAEIAQMLQSAVQILTF